MKKSLPKPPPIKTEGWDGAVGETADGGGGGGGGAGSTGGGGTTGK